MTDSASKNEVDSMLMDCASPKLPSHANSSLTLPGDMDRRTPSPVATFKGKSQDITELMGVKTNESADGQLCPEYSFLQGLQSRIHGETRIINGKLACINRHKIGLF